MNRSERLAKQLGMSYGAANNKLRKAVLFKYVKLAGHNFCHKCGVEIETVDDLSVEHILPWEGRNTELYWDLDNIAFSHLKCNKPHDYSKGPSKKSSYVTRAWCSSCQQELGINQFHKDTSRHSGVQGRCKSCHASYKREKQ